MNLSRALCCSAGTLMIVFFLLGWLVDPGFYTAAIAITTLVCSVVCFWLWVFDR